MKKLVKSIEKASIWKTNAKLSEIQVKYAPI